MGWDSKINLSDKWPHHLALFLSADHSKCFATLATFTHWWQWLPTTNCTSGAIWGSVSRSRTLRHAAQPHHSQLEPGYEPATNSNYWTTGPELQPPLNAHSCKYTHPTVTAQHLLFFTATLSRNSRDRAQKQAIVGPDWLRQRHHSP